MKVAVLALIAVTAMPALGVDFVRQIQLVQGQTVVYDMPVSGLNGQILSKPLEGDGAVIQLYAYQDETYDPFSLLNVGVGGLANVNVALDSHLVNVNLLGIHLNVILGGSGDYQPLPQLIDEVTVGAHLPEATLTLRSEDTYNPPRTRADRPFSMNLSIRKLAEPGDPRGGIGKVTLERDFKFYHPDLHVPYPNGSGQGSYEEAYEFTKNGNFADAEIYQALPAQSPTKACGEETFSAVVKISNNREAAIASSTIQIWPVCDATIEGLQSGKRYPGIPPQARVLCNDLYPDSVTYAQIYKGQPNLGTTGKIIGSSVVSFNTYAPQDAVVPLTVTENEIGEDGTYTIEVLTVTPFNGRHPERVTYVTFEIDRTIKVNGSIATSEK
ncbi:hypothetical protein OKA04_01700 [Luteolibacter flavescens]|uniref:Uncharacterized protein n=1 Tax=Luteolibacter flavescens TaxID=1859460 RepID=A0ABT3FIN0_9BACT|nr:hypothetical protein [Luteolibacter flavescens]MCW1883423.1 hypothetical protein [Luteolibacter flavescens]